MHELLFNRRERGERIENPQPQPQSTLPQNVAHELHELTLIAFLTAESAEVAEKNLKFHSSPKIAHELRELTLIAFLTAESAKDAKKNLNINLKSQSTLPQNIAHELTLIAFLTAENAEVAEKNLNLNLKSQIPLFHKMLPTNCTN